MAKASDGDFQIDPNDSLGYLCRIAFRNFSRALERRTLPHGISSGQWRFLRVLWIEDGITQRELSRRVGLREPTTVTALKALEKAGLIHRWQSKEDRRKLHVYVTPKARQLKLALSPYIVEVNEIATQGLSSNEVEVLQDLLRRVGHNLSEDVDSDRPLDSSI